ncbi:MAG: hypothetical protein IT449_04595 [Phycisphaerales bacterium]|nr:hypothetical protein [Phycisphaerales bacterium]
MLRQYAVRMMGVFAAVTLFFAAGCDNLTIERFNTIQNGDSQAAVEATIGVPNDKVMDYWRWYRGDRQLEVFVHFDKEGKVASKSWVGEGRTYVEDLPGAESDGDVHKSTRIQSINKP